MVDAAGVAGGTVSGVVAASGEVGRAEGIVGGSAAGLVDFEKMLKGF
jgi:hypothetical protein